MEHLSSALGLMEKDCFMAPIDLTDAYYSVNVEKSSRKFLRFIWNDRLYQFTCLAQGLSCSPRIFTKLMKPLFAKLRSLGYLSVYYLDDSLLIGKDLDECTRNVSSTKDVLEKAGFIINKAKSQFSPSKEIIFLGFVLNSSNMTVSLPMEKKVRIYHSCDVYLQDTVFIIRDIASFIGLLVSSLPAIQYGGIFYRYLEKCKINALKLSRGNFDGTMKLDKESKNEIQWWKSNIMTSFKEINISLPSIYICTDASLSGWGCCYCDMNTGGQWTPEESKSHINVLELKAILFGIKSFLNDRNYYHIRIRSDSTTAVSYINNLGGVKSLPCHKVAKDIWLWAFERNNHLSAEHLPGSENIQADKASRVFDENTEWQLSPEMFKSISDKFGPFDIDLFASRLNAQCAKYCSWKPDPNASFVDSFNIFWGSFNLPYIFPPFSVIMKCLQKICEDQVRVLFIAPLWTTQPWFPKMMRLLVDVPIVLPLGVLRLPFKERAVHKQHKNLRLVVCLLSGKSMDRKTFLKAQSPLSVLPGDIPLNFNIRFIMKNGYLSVVEGKLIPCVIMK